MTKTSVGLIRSEEEAERHGLTLVDIWLKKIEAARQARKGWHEEAKQAVLAFEASDETVNRPRFNVWHSSIKTIVPALYNSTPALDIRMMHGDQTSEMKPVAKAAISILERAVQWQLNSLAFDDEMSEGVETAQICGDAFARVRYIPHADLGADPERGDEFDAIVHEEATVEIVPWDRWGYGPGRKWARVPFVWFDHDLTEAEVRRLLTPAMPELAEPPEFDAQEPMPDVFGEVDPMEIDAYEQALMQHEAAQAAYQEQVQEASRAYMEQGQRAEERIKRLGFGSSIVSTDGDGESHKGVLETIPVHEIWCRTTRKIYFISPKDEAESLPLRVNDDELKFPDFFPGERLIFNRCKSSALPVVSYSVIKPLLDEINEASVRISRMVKDLRARALADPKIRDDLERLADADDGEVVPAGNIDEFSKGGANLDQMIAWWPVEKVIMVIRELQAHREQLKQQVFEVSGISDILRGSTDPNETLGAQQIKASWGSQRVNAQQREVQQWVRDILRKQSHVIATRFSPDILAQMVGMERDEQFDQAVGLLRSYNRNFVIDIETDSTIRGDLGRDMEQWQQFLTGTAQFTQALGTLATAAPQVMGGFVELYGEFVQRFRLGKRGQDIVERMIEAAQQPPPQPEQQAGPSPEEAQMQQQANDRQVQVGEAKATADMAKAEAQMIKSASDIRKAEIAAGMAPGSGMM